MATPAWVTNAITAIDAQIAAFTAAIAAGTPPAGVQTLSVAGRSISYSDPADGLSKLIKLRQELATLEGIASGTAPRFSRAVVSGRGRF